ncbi:MAG: hypothetical protein CM15mP45_20800 [Deltaproteobacteria bacterium]|nr:MAG: hypothetical protein CM15mP45_20800 [Deltaproteobacteria bacterium]
MLSRAIAVVRGSGVAFDIPPSMIAMPTSEATRPNDASRAETSPKRTSKNSVQAARRGEAPG